MSESSTCELCNEGYELRIECVAKEIIVHWRDLRLGQDVVDRPYLYRAIRAGEEASIIYEGLVNPIIESAGEEIHIQGLLAGLHLQHVLRLPADKTCLEEQITLHNPGNEVVTLKDLLCGFQRTVSDGAACVLPALAHQRLTALPLKHRASDPPAWDHSFTLEELLRLGGAEQRATATLGYGYAPSLRRGSEGWAWQKEDAVFWFGKHNQQGLEFSVLTLEPREEAVSLCFGGTAMLSGDPSALTHIQPGETITLGLTRYETLTGSYHQAAYAFRRFLDEQGCRFPADYDPPVHWNELYDNPEWHVQSPTRRSRVDNLRPITYTRPLLEEEAAKAVAYGAEALYLDPGWDTDFGTFLWGTEWLGQRREFVALLREKYGLGLSLHCPLATWMSMDGRGLSSWPTESWRMDANGRLIEGSVCLGSRQYLEAAAERLLAHCADGVVFLMFDGNWWNGGCWNPAHGHPVPYTKEDHIRANLYLARRIHEKYPNVLIEMHDMVTGGTRQRYTPVYYKYGLPGSYDENWGFELMWQPMEDILSGRARALYYYNLGCNVPIYLHIDLRDDNIHCLVLWWYASTCRHLGIGGTHRDPLVAEAQRRAMALYRKLKPFYVRGEFYGSEECPEEAHFHVLKEQNAVVLNLFNLHDQSRVLSGSIEIEQLGINPDLWYIVPDPHVWLHDGRLYWNRRLPAYGTDILQVWPVTGLGSSTRS